MFELQSTLTVKQIVRDEYHNAMYEKYGERYIEYRSNWEKALAGEYKPDYPMHIDLELANACNYRCSFCPYSQPPSERPKGYNIKDEKIMDMKIIEKVLSESNGKLYAVELGYNTEPLLHKQIIDIIKLCKKNNVLDIRMGTNGSLLGKISNDELIYSGLTQLQVSIDAINEETYLKARNSKNYKLIVGNLKRLIQRRNELEQKFPRVRVTYVMTPENIPNKDIFIKQWDDIADIIGIQDLMTYESGPKQDTSSLKNIDPKSFDSCYMPKVRMSIRSNGDVQPCCTVEGMKLKIGNIKDRTISEIWGGHSMKKIRNSHYDGTWTQNKICATCITNTFSEK